MTSPDRKAPAVLIWEDATDNPSHWWISRVQHLGHELVIAEDEFTASILLLGRPGGGSNLSVISAFRHEDPASAIAAAKAAAVQWLENEDRQELRSKKWRWQIARGLRMWLFDLPLIGLAVTVGTVIGWLVGVFFDTTGQRGLWTILFGLVIGGTLGPLLSSFVKRGLGSKRSSTYRTFLVMLCAGTFGAGTVALMVLPGG